MNIDALKKIADGEDSSKGNESKGSAGGEIIPLAVGGGAGLLAHSLMAPEDKEEAKKESIWSKLLRWLTVAGASAGAYYLTKGINPPASSPRVIDELEQQKDDSEGTASALKWGGRGFRWGGIAGASTAAGNTLLKPAIQHLLRRTPPGMTLMSNVKANAKASWPIAALSVPAYGIGWGLSSLADHYDLKAKELQRKLDAAM